jgi:hypothetical protein
MFRKIFLSLFIVLIIGLQTFGQVKNTKTIALAGGFVEIPANYKIEFVYGADFDVELIYFGASQAEAKAILGVYTGDNPNFAPSKTAKMQKMKLGKRTVKWYFETGKKNEKTIYSYNALINLGKYSGFFHLAISGADEKEVQNLFAIFRTFRQTPEISESK